MSYPATTTFTIIAFCLVFTPVHLSLGDESDASPSVEVSFQAFLPGGSFDGNTPGFRDPADGFVPITIDGANSLGAVHRYTGPNPLLIYQADRVIASVRIPEDMKEAILLLLKKTKGETGGPRFHIIPLYADAERFPPGSYLLVNQSGLHLEIQVADHELVLPPATEKVVQPAVETEQAIAARFFIIEDGEKLRSNQQAWYFQPQFRKMVILTRDHDVDRSLRIQTVSDRGLELLEESNEEEGADSPSVIEKDGIL